MDQPSEAMTADQIAVTEMVYDIDRDAPTIRFLLRERRRQLAAPVEEILDQLLGLGDVATVPGTSLVRATEEGRTRLRAGQEWTFEILEAFSLPSIHPKPLLRGRVLAGVVRSDDWFKTSTGIVGQVLAVEFLNHRGLAADETIVLRVDRDGLAEGDFLRMYKLPEPG